MAPRLPFMTSLPLAASTGTCGAVAGIKGAESNGARLFAPTHSSSSARALVLPGAWTLASPSLMLAVHICQGQAPTVGVFLMAGGRLID